MKISNGLKKNISIRNLSIFLLLIVLALSPGLAKAAITLPSVDLPSDLAVILGNIINYVLGLVTLIAVLMLIWGGIQYLTAAGDEAQVEGAKKTIMYAIIGLVVVGISYAIVVVVVNQFIGAA